MRELAKSMISVSMGMGLMATKAATMVVSQKNSEEALQVTQQFLGNMSRLTQDALGPEMRRTFDYGDEIQRRVVDAGMGAVDGKAFDPAQVFKMGSDSLKRATQMFTRFGSDDEM